MEKSSKSAEELVFKIGQHLGVDITTHVLNDRAIELICRGQPRYGQTDLPALMILQIRNIGSVADPTWRFASSNCLPFCRNDLCDF